jgi:hypothetical protein
LTVRDNSEYSRNRTETEARVIQVIEPVSSNLKQQIDEHRRQ